MVQPSLLDEKATGNVGVTPTTPLRSHARSRSCATAREQLPWSFSGLHGSRWISFRLPIVVNVVRGCVPSGDYSILGYRVVGCKSKRKSLEELLQHHRAAPQTVHTCELDRLQLLQAFHAVVVEARVESDDPHAATLALTPPPPKNV